MAATIAIIVPIVQGWFNAIQERRRARSELSSLLDAIMVSLEESVKEATWAASAGVDIVVARILQPDIMSALPPATGQRVVGAIMRAERHLHNDERRNLARANDGIVRDLRAEGTDARKAIFEVQAEVQALYKP
jgi:hypothetical protein